MNLTLILLTLNNIVNTSLVSEINKCLESSFLKDSIFVKVDCTLEEFNKIDLSYVDFVFIDCSDFSMENYSLFKHRLFNYQKFVYLYNTDDFYAN